VFSALQTFLGSAYVNDFNLLGRTFRVTAQADSDFRVNSKDVLKLRVRNSAGDTVPRGTFTTVSDVSAPARVPRYNLYPAAELDGSAAPGFSQGQAIDLMQQVAAEVLPQGFSYEWTDLAFQQIRAGNTAAFAFALGVVFVFLVLAAQFESLTLPLAVILIVEFAAQLESQGHDKFEAAKEAARLRMRPIIMTSLAFILGVVPLVWAVGAGAELRQALGTAVFSGMIGVTVFGLIFTPVFYVVCRWLGQLFTRRPAGGDAPAPAPAE
jgi:multidrug efflux pump subunit AcrB